MLPVYTRFLTPADYGVLELLTLNYTLFTTLVGMRYADSLFYYFFKAPDQKSRDETVSNAFIGAALLGCGTLLLGWVFAPYLSRFFFQTPAYAGFVRLSLASYTFLLPVESGCAYLRALNRSGTYVWISLLRLGLQLGLNVVLLVGFQLGVAAMLWTEIIAGRVCAIILAKYCLSGRRITFRFKTFFQFVRYSMPYAGGGLCMMFIHFGDRWFLQRTVSLAELGVYALAYKLGMVVENVVTPYAIYRDSQVFEILLHPNGEPAYVRFATYVALGLTLVPVLITVFGKPVLHVMVTPGFQAAAPLAPCIAFAYVLRALDGHFRSIFRVEAKTGRDASIMAVGALACLAAYAGLIPVYKLWGAAFATLLGFSVMLLYGLHQAQKLRRFPFEFRRLSQILACGAVTILFFYWLGIEGFWRQLATGVGVACLFPALLVVTRFFHKDEVQMLRAATAVIQRFSRSDAQPGVEGKGSRALAS